MAAIAKRAVGDLVELRSLSGAVVLIEASYARCLDDLDALLTKDGVTPQLVGYVKEKGLLPEERPAPASRKPVARSGIRPVGNRRIDVFDTDRMTDGVPQSGNLLTNYTLDLSDVNGESLWLCSYYYEAAQAYKDKKGPKDLPVARRRDGWSFLLADAEDMQRLNRVTLDGETVLAQMAGELVDVSALSWASEVADVLAPQVAQFHHLLESTGAERVEDLGIPATILQGIASSCEREESREPRF